MLSVALRNVSKMYRLYDRPPDRLKEMLWRGRRRYHREFWALRNVSFEIEGGTTVGLIGVNGSGKTTLLEIIAGTLQPTAGTVERVGRVAALLELGAGFNPEHTGRENVFFSGALLGFSPDEIGERFPAIERFAEIGEFIDQPVKTYSSGMYVRLAFSTAIHVDPDILLIDEALAVGDAIFTNRCFRRLEEMQRKGVTIVFASHDLAAVTRLCQRALLVHQGQVTADGEAASVLNRYQEIIMSREQRATPAVASSAPPPPPTLSWDEPEVPMHSSYRHGDQAAQIVRVELLDRHLRPTGVLEVGEPAVVRVVVRARQYLSEPVVGILIRNRLGIELFGTNTALEGVSLGPCHPGEKFDIRYAFDCSLAAGECTLTVAVHTRDAVSHDWLDDILAFQVVASRHTQGLAYLKTRVTLERRPGRS